MGRLMRLIENGRLDQTVLTTHRFKFEDIEKAFNLMASKSDGVIKPLITY
jgi:threonine dehydrogenase-like Zn-dependent dehydrogenase